MSDRFTVVRDPVLGEEVHLARARNGVPVRVLTSDRFREVCAVVSFGYGSTDLAFRLSDGRVHRSPEGVAHFLEHELFEDEELHVFERFARRGARVNAMTGFARTTYHVQCSHAIDENLDDLLRLVSRVHLSAARVEKERGIIAQEVRMYEDGPEYRGFFALLGELYPGHPVRHPVGGTVESIGRIDVAELDTCFRSFYRAGNCGIAVAGPVEPAAVLERIDAFALTEGDPPPRERPEAEGAVAGARRELAMDVKRPRLLLGYRVPAPIVDVEHRAHAELCTRVVLDRVLGATSELRESMQVRGVLDDSLSTTVMDEATFGVAVIACETDDPDATASALRDALERPLAWREDDLDRIRRKQLGGYVRSLDAVQAMAFQLAEEALEGVAPFRAVARMQAVTLDDVRARQRELFDASRSAVAIVRARS